MCQVHFVSSPFKIIKMVTGNIEDEDDDGGDNDTAVRLSTTSCSRPTLKVFSRHVMICLPPSSSSSAFDVMVTLTGTPLP